MAPVLGTLKKEGMTIPGGWNAKSKCTPEWEKVRTGIEEELSKCESDVRKKSEGWTCSDEVSDKQKEKEVKKGRRVRSLGYGVNWTLMEREFEEIDECGGRGLKEEEVQEVKRRLRGLTVAPVDKYTAELVAM